jgi:hypothetical protein
VRAVTAGEPPWTAQRTAGPVDGRAGRPLGAHMVPALSGCTLGCRGGQLASLRWRSHWSDVVEVVRRYSNRPDLLGPMLDMLRRIENGDQADEPGVCSTGRGTGSAPVRLRLSEADVRDIVTRFSTGVAKHRLATEYGVSLSTMKRLLRR